MNKEVIIDYLYLDITTCTRCQGSDLNLEKALEMLKRNFPEHEFTLNKYHIDTIDLAWKQKFQSSPTIRVNGKDLPLEFRENNCDSCGDFCGDNVDCRIWVYQGEAFETAPTNMLVDLIADYLNEKSALIPLASNYTLPQNLIHFFSARLKKENLETKQENSCACGAGDDARCC